MHNRWRRNATVLQHNCLVEGFSRIFTPRRIFSCVAILVLTATVCSLFTAHLTVAAALGSRPTRTRALVVTARINSCIVPAEVAESLSLDADDPAARAQAAAKGTAGHLSPLATDLTSARADLTVECGYSLYSSSGSRWGRLAKLQQSQQQVNESALQQNLEVVGLDVLTCKMHNQHRQQLQGQYYVFVLRDADAEEGCNHHVVEYAPMPASDSDRQAALQSLLSRWDQRLQPLGCFTNSTHTSRPTPSPLIIRKNSPSTQTRHLLDDPTNGQPPEPSPDPQQQPSPSPSPEPSSPLPEPSSPSPSPNNESLSPSPAQSPSPEPSSPSPSPSPPSETPQPSPSPVPESPASSPDIQAGDGPEDEPIEGPANCSLPIVTGTCRGSFPRWAFNATTGICQSFTYGGCKGNSNNFASKEVCEQTCNSTLTSNVTASPSSPPLAVPSEPVVIPVEMETRTGNNALLDCVGWHILLAVLVMVLAAL